MRGVAIVIVCDASVIVAGLIRAGESRELLSSEDVQIPHLADYEVLHAMRGGVLRRLVSPVAAAEGLRRWHASAVVRHAAAATAGRAWALRGTLSAYDASYVALAEILDCPLATGDARMTRAPGVRCSFLVPAT